MPTKISLPTVLVLCGCLTVAFPAPAASDKDIDDLTTYAVLIGRAVGCGEDVDYGMKRVGAWMDKKFPPGSNDQKTYLPIFMNGVKYHMQQQQAGGSPDSCSKVRESFRKVRWP